MSKTISGFARFAAIALLLAGPAAHSGEPLDRREMLRVIDSTLEAFHEYYIYPDVVVEMESYVRDRIAGGGYDGIASLAGLTKQMRIDFRRISNDRHIWIDIMENMPVDNADASIEEIANEKRKSNFGFVKFELLPENVGYLRIDSFDDVSYAGETAVSAMGMLANSDAVILDLRYNHGGHESMVRLVSSYFFKERTQLNSLYFRAADSLVEGWTDPAIPGKKPTDAKLYILTSGNTASGAESFAYMMKQYKRTLIVGEKTRGAAHWTECYPFPELGVFLEIPVARPINPVTNTGWEGTGVEPDIQAPADKALEAAYNLAIK